MIEFCVALRCLLATAMQSNVCDTRPGYFLYALIDVVFLTAPCVIFIIHAEDTRVRAFIR